MSVNLFKIKKWTNMLLGRSSYHVNQSEGKYYSIDRITGYYNDLTEKVTRFPMPEDEIPITADEDGSKRHFCIAIFQYGLASYDLWITRREDHYLRKFKNCIEWAIANQKQNGAWEAFFPQNPSQPFSSMAQGEGISLLVRASIELKDRKYSDAAKRALDFLLTERRLGGVADITDTEIRFFEFTYKPLVLNGWIFSIWGILDYYKLTKDTAIYDLWQRSIKTIIKELPKFDCGYWSYYDTSGALTSSFYQNLHIAQMKAMYRITGEKEFEFYAEKWQQQLNNPCLKALAFFKKAYQKIIE